MAAQCSGRRVIISGVTRGLGRAMTNEFIRLGHWVSGCGRTKEAINQLRLMHPSCDFRIADVRNAVEVREWATQVLKCGPPDIVINNAATLGKKARLWDVSPEEFSEIIDTNVKGIVNVVRCFVPAMRSQSSGVLVNMISRWGLAVETKMAPYCSSKWAAVALTRTISEELRCSGVVAVGLNPGIVNTAMLHQFLDDSHASSSAYPSPEEWAKVAVPRILKLSSNDAGKLRTVRIKSSQSARRISPTHT